ncbi:L-threonylcarbamoyladenylate synthase [Thermodesulfovibrionales bacterium]|nr:L-threonylcarbamoyladenylate synthase [Thermodesulfovibrionales bacterium]
MRFVVATPLSIKEGADIIRKGGLVAFPTETVYGLGADALNPEASARIFKAKNRPEFDPLIVHIAGLSSLEKLCLSVDERAKRLINKFWPGPLTLVLPKSEIVPDIVTAGLPTVAIRMPAHPIALELIKEAGVPIAAPSANPFGYISSTTAWHVREQLGERVDLILDGGRCTVGVESTIIKLAEGAILLRPGGVTIEEIEEVIGRVEILSNNLTKLEAPGQLQRHYSPMTPLKILGDKSSKIQSKIPRGKRVGLLAFTPPKADPSRQAYAMVEVLTPSGDLKEAVLNLFSCLYRLDKAGLDIIHVEPLLEVGLGMAIMDRLKRAAGNCKL